MEVQVWLEIQQIHVYPVAIEGTTGWYKFEIGQDNQNMYVKNKGNANEETEAILSNFRTRYILIRPKQENGKYGFNLYATKAELEAQLP